MIDWVKLRFQYLKESNPTVSDEILLRKAKEQFKTIRITLPKAQALAWQKELVEREIEATKKLAKMMGKRRKLHSVMRWAEMVEEAMLKELGK